MVGENRDRGTERGGGGDMERDEERNNRKVCLYYFVSPFSTGVDVYFN